MSQEDIERLKSSVNLGTKVEKRISASQLLYSAINSAASTEPSTPIGYRTPELMASPSELNITTTWCCENSEDNTQSEILRQLFAMNARLSRIEEKVDKISARLDRVQRDKEATSSLNDLFAGLSVMENGIRNFARLQNLSE